MKKRPVDYFRMFYGDTVVGGADAALQCGLSFFGADHVLFAGPEIQIRLLTLGLSTDGGGTPESTAQTIDKEQAHWRALAKELNVEPQ